VIHIRQQHYRRKLITVASYFHWSFIYKTLRQVSRTLTLNNHIAFSPKVLRCIIITKTKLALVSVCFKSHPSKTANSNNIRKFNAQTPVITFISVSGVP